MKSNIEDITKGFSLFNDYYNNKELIKGNTVISVLKNLKNKVKTNEIDYLIVKYNVNEKLNFNLFQKNFCCDKIEDGNNIKLAKFDNFNIYLRLLYIGLFYFNNNYKECYRHAADFITYLNINNLFIFDYLYMYCAKYLVMSLIHLKEFNNSKSVLIGLYNEFNVNNNLNAKSLVINFILKLYLDNNNYEEAAVFLDNCGFPEEKNNNEIVKYLYYSALIKAMEGNYIEANFKANLV